MDPLRSFRFLAPSRIGCARLFTALLALSVGGCGSKSAGKTGTGCVSGESIACAGVHGCPGYQVCRSDGSGYEPCTCGDGGSRAFPQVGPYSGLLGAACSTNDDCRTGFDCVAASSNLIKGEGPSSGMCLQQCIVAHDFCTSVDATAQCVVLDDKGTADTSDDLSYCMPGCKIGKQPASADKCRGRVDLVCSETPVGSGAGYCRPACRNDVDCAPRKCDLRTGLCGDATPSGDPIGIACAPGSATCAAACYAASDTFDECSGVCSYGTEGCGQTTFPPLDFFCAIPVAAGSGPGDLGYCAKLCDCDDDCGRQDAVCEAESSLVSSAGRHGYCASKALPTGGTRTGLPCAQ